MLAFLPHQQGYGIKVGDNILGKNRDSSDSPEVQER